MDPESFLYDVFINYSRKDTELIKRNILPILDQHGIKYWIDSEYKEGRPVADKLPNAIRNSRKMVSILTANWLESDYARYELYQIQTFDPLNKEGRVLPLLLEPIELPEEIGFLDYFNASNSNDFEQTMSQVLDAIQTSTPLPNRNIYLQGVILCGNIMGFSTLKSDDRNRVIDFITSELQTFSGKYPYKWLDFQGGEFMLFLESSPQNGPSPKDAFLRAFMLGLQMQWNSHGSSFRIGMTLHWEADGRWHKVKERDYLTGKAIDEARLLMSFSGHDHFFISRQAYEVLWRDLFDAEETDLHTMLCILNEHVTFSNNWPLFREIKLGDIDLSAQVSCNSFTFYDRHKRQHQLYNFIVQSEQYRIGNSIPPYHRVSVEYRSLREHNRQNAFINRLIEADEVSIIGLTHEGTRRFLEEALHVRKTEKGKGFWDRLQIVFPSRKIVNSFVDPDREEKDRIAAWVAAKRGVQEFLLNQGPNYIDHWECLEYDGPFPFIGNRFIGGRSKSVRIAPVLPGTDLRTVFYIEFFQGVTSYEQISKTFDYICTRSSKIVEWTLYGTWQENEFRYSGIVNRRRLGRLIEQNISANRRICIPVVLIMLHTIYQGRKKSILQCRTLFNASSDIGKYSNISGRVTDMDVFNSQNLNNFSKSYLHTTYSAIAPNDDQATVAFEEVSGWKKGDMLEDMVWKMTAIREVKEEIGLDLEKEPERLVLQAEKYLWRKDRDLFFKLFSLELRRGVDDELAIIEKLRPEANLHPFDKEKLINEKSKENEVKNGECNCLNALLNEEFHPAKAEDARGLFYSIFKDQLRIDGF